MNREDIIRMAREAGIRVAGPMDNINPYNVYVHELQRFAALVAAAERERAEKAEAALALENERNQMSVIPQNPCSCVPDGDNGTVAHLCAWHKKDFGKAYRMQRLANTVTVTNFSKLRTEQLKLFIAHCIQESSARKRAEAENAEAAPRSL